MTGSSFSSTSGSIDQIAKMFMGPSRAETARIVEESNAELIMSEIDAVLIDRIFSSSLNLSSESIQYFVSNLCQVSLQEISVTSSLTNLRGKDIVGDTGTPRVFSMQKIVEVADVNMNCRPRIAWANIWSLLAQHFTTVGLNDNLALSMFAIDSLKQLSIKFLQKEELTNFNFQRLFLKPFEVIMNRTKATEIKELILRCLGIMIQACAPNIRSGWRSIFAIFEIAASHEKFEISNIAFDITERLMSNQFHLLIYDFVELMNCLVAFVAGSHSALSLAALAHLAKCAEHLAQGKVEPALFSQQRASDSMGISWEKSKPATVDAQIGEDASVFRLWWPLLLGLSTRVADVRLEVRTLALETLHRVLKLHGHLFSPQTWEVVFKGVLFPIIDSAKTDLTSQPQSQWPTQNPAPSKDPFSWIGTTAAASLSVCIQLFLMFRTRANLTSSLLPELLLLFEGCICQDIESFAKMGMSALSDLLLGLELEPNTSRITPLSPTRLRFNSNSDDNILNQVNRNSTMDVLELVSQSLSNCILRNLCLNFGEAGSLKFDTEVPETVQDLLERSPMSGKRKFNETRGRGGGEVGTSVVTPYGSGKIIQVIPSTSESSIAARNVVKLTWGLLYTPEKQTAALTQPAVVTSKSETASISSSPQQATRISRVQSWGHLSVSAMSSMVVTLDAIRVLDNVLNHHYVHWELSQLSLLMSSEEAVFHHARMFNDNLNLRQSLKQKGFMRFRDNAARLPHLLEQETWTASKLLSFSLRLFREEGGGQTEDSRAKFAESWIHRISVCVSKRYCELDNLAITTPGDWFVSEQLSAYLSPMTIVLKGILCLSKQQFRRNVYWIAPLLADANLCADRTVRLCVHSIAEKHSTPLLLLAAKLLPEGIEDSDDVFDSDI